MTNIPTGPTRPLANCVSLRPLYPPASEASRAVANLTKRKNPHTPMYGVIRRASVHVQAQFHYIYSHISTQFSQLKDVSKSWPLSIYKKGFRSHSSQKEICVEYLRCQDRRTGRS